MIFSSSDEKKLGKITPLYQKELQEILDRYKVVIVPIMNKYGLNVEIQLEEEPDLSKPYNKKRYQKDINKLRPKLDTEISVLNSKYGVQLLPTFERFNLGLKVALQKKKS